MSECARLDLSLTRTVPNIWLVIDGSAGMAAPLDHNATTTVSRWTALRQVLLDPDRGIVKSLERDFRFGMILFDGPRSDPTSSMFEDGGTADPADTCPRTIVRQPQRSSFSSIDQAYPLAPLAGLAPTDQALQELIQQLNTIRTTWPDQAQQPTLVVLVTASDPSDACGLGSEHNDVQTRAITAVRQVAAAGDLTYVISLAEREPAVMQFCSQLAAAGATNKPAFAASTQEALMQAFNDILTPAVSCDLTLNGMIIAGMECKGQLKLNGVALRCGDDDGWRLKHPSTITLNGAACETLRSDDQALLQAEFPCEAVRLD